MSLSDQLNKLSPREQKLLGGLCTALILFVVLGVPAYAYSRIATMREHNEAMVLQLQRISRAGELLAERRQERDARDSRYARPAPALASFIESAASANGLEVPESKDQPEMVHKGFIERPTKVKMRKVGLKPLVKMLEKIERSGYPLAISRLRINKKASPDQFDVELIVSAYEKSSKASKKGAKGSGTKGTKL